MERVLLSERPAVRQSTRRPVLRRITVALQITGGAWTRNVGEEL